MYVNQMAQFFTQIKRHWQLTAVAALVFIHAFINFIWLSKDTYPLWFDFGGYFQRSLQIYFAAGCGLKDFFEAVLAVGKYIHSFQPYRVLLPLSTVPWYFLFGTVGDTAVMSCTVFLAIALFSTYGITSKLFDKTKGFLAAFFLSVSPEFYTFYRRYSPEFAATAMIALTAFLLWQSKNFQSRKYSILAAISFGLGILAKELSFIYIVGIAIYSFYKGMAKKRLCLVNFLIFVFLSAVIAFLFYGLHSNRVLHNIFNSAYSHAMAQSFHMDERWSAAGLLFYIKIMFTYGFSLDKSLFFIIGLILFLKNKIPGRGFIFSWLIIPYIFLISLSTRASYYGMPLLIPMSMVAAYGVTEITKKDMLRRLLVLTMLLIGIFSLLVHTFAVFGSSSLRLLNPGQYNEFLYPIKEDWKLEEIMDYVRANAPKREGVIRIHVGANLAPLSAMTLGYVATQKKMDADFGGYNVATQDVLSYDFVIVKSGEKQGIFYSVQQAQELVGELEKGGFIQLPKKFLLPDYSFLTVYKKKIE